MDVTPAASRTGKSRRRKLLMLALAICAPAGCTSGPGLLPESGTGPHDTTASFHDNVGMKIEYPDVHRIACAPGEAAMSTQAPLTFDDPAKLPTLEMTLAEAIQIAVTQSEVLRSIGGSVVQTPQAATTVYEPALSYANPVTGVEAALSEFDAQLNSGLIWGQNRVPSNVEQGGLGAAFNPQVFRQSLSNFNVELSKQTATGGRFALRHVINYDRNNQPFRQFPSDFEGWVEAEWRQPLLQGSGTLYNRIAGTQGFQVGPFGTIGQYNGVLIARINNDVELADFENGVINLVAEVEEVYWELYFAYRSLEAQLRGREAALKTYQGIELRARVGIDASDDLAQAASQFFLFDSQVQNTLAGPNGVYFFEQRLRYLLGMPASDGRLIKPSTSPQDARVIFDWQSALSQSLERRVEIRRQQWLVKRRELELIAARLNRRPRLDWVSSYRWRGLGDTLFGGNDAAGDFDSVYDSIATGDFQEWTAGMELAFPIGLRRASAAVSHAQLNLARERAVLCETELRVSHELANSVREVERAYRLMQTNLNRWLADQRQTEILRAQYLEGITDIFILLQTQRQLISSETDFYRSLTEYNLAIRELHRQKGSLLAYNQVQLSEGPWPAQAYEDAHDIGRFFTPRVHPEKVSMPRPVSRGDFDPSAPMSTQAGMPFASEMIETPPPVQIAPVPSDAANGAPVQQAPQSPLPL